MAKKAKVYTGTEWVDLAAATADLSQYSNLITNQPTFRNVLINGGFSIDQRNSGASQTFTAAAALAYSVDRWYGFCTGANITGARVAGTAPSQFFYRFTGATSNTAVGFGQRIEAANCFHLANQTVTLGINIASTSLTSITWTAFYANTTDTFGTLASPTRTQIATGTFAVTSTLGRKTATFGVPAAATTGIEIVFTGGALLGSQTLTYDDAQLEVGSVASAFEQRPIGIELALCHRYFCTVADGAVSTQMHIGLGGYYQAGFVTIECAFPVSMRSSAVTLVATSGTNYYINYSNNNSGDTLNSWILNVSNFNKALIYNGTDVSGTSGFVSDCRLNNALAKISFSTEL
jgi:hypothetical protein